jgi:hypothetical protein
MVATSKVIPQEILDQLDEQLSEQDGVLMCVTPEAAEFMVLGLVALTEITPEDEPKRTALIETVGQLYESASFSQETTEFLREWLHDNPVIEVDLDDEEPLSQDAKTLH